jgi:hypothetical protein
MGQILKIEPNVPNEIALKFSDGITVPGQYGNRVLFTLADERKLYAPPIVADKLKEMRIERGERFSLCKVIGAGNKVTWEVKRVDPAPASGPEVAIPPASPPATLRNTRTNGNTRPLPDAPFSHTGWAGFLRDQATSLIDVAASCSRYSAEKYPGLLSNEDVGRPGDQRVYQPVEEYDGRDAIAMAEPAPRLPLRSGQHTATRKPAGLARLSTAPATSTSPSDTVICEDCSGRGVDPGSLNQPEECPSCCGAGYLMSPEYVARIQEQYRRKPARREDRLPVGYFEEMKWRLGE